MQTRRLGASDLELTPVVFGAWGIGEPGVTAALVGARTAAQAAENARAAAVRLSGDERRAVARAFSTGEQESP